MTEETYEPVSLLPAERDALTDLGWPSDRMYSSKGKVLATIALDPDASDREAAERAGLTRTTISKWKARDELFAAAYERARQIVSFGPDDPERVRIDPSLAPRAAASVEILRRMQLNFDAGRATRTRFQRRGFALTWNEHVRILRELNAQLAAQGSPTVPVPEPRDVPPEIEPEEEWTAKWPLHVANPGVLQRPGRLR
jgi:hypothetical protein